MAIATTMKGRDRLMTSDEETAAERETSEQTVRLLKLNREYQAKLQQQIEAIRQQRVELERRKAR